MFSEGIVEFFTHVFDAAFICQQIAIALSVVIVLGSVNIFRPTLKGALTMLWQTVMMIAVSFTVNVLLFTVTYMTKGFLRGLNFPLSILLSTVFYAALFCKYELRPRIMTAAVITGAAMILEDWGGLFGRALNIAVPGFDSMVTKIISDFILLGFALLIRKLSVADLNVAWFDMLLNLVVTFVSVFGVIFYDAVSGAWFSTVTDYVRMFIAVLFLLLFIVEAVAYVTTYCLCRDRRTIYMQRAESQKQLAELEAVRLSEKHFKELKEMRHDLKNKYAYMQGMLSAGETEELKKYFELMSGEIGGTLKRYFDCGNKRVNAIINFEKSKAALGGVEIETDITVPRELPFAETDLVSLMTNMIDNAVEECIRIPEKNKTVSVTMNTQGGQTYLCVTNPTDKPKKAASNKMATAKKDKELHGLGMDIISRLAKKYGGYFRCRIEDGVFSAEVLLDSDVKVA